MTIKLSDQKNIYATQWENRQPDNLDFLRPTGFRFLIQILPKVTYFCQAANIPELSLGVTMQPTPFVDIPLPGDKLTYGSLQVKFLIQEDLGNYTELYNWLIGLGFPESRQQFADFVGAQAYRYPDALGKSTGTQYSDATLLVLGSDNIPVSAFTFHECFPVSLSGMDFDISTGNTQYFQATAEFRFRHYSIASLL